jgi:cytochrome c5
MIRIILGLCFVSISFQLLAVSKPSDLVTQRCAPCHGPDLNGVGGVFPSLLTSKVVKQGGLDAVVKFITYGSPPNSQSQVKMPAKGGHLDLTDEQIKQIAEEVIEHAVAYTPAKVSPSQGTSGNAGYFKERYGPLVSSAIEISPLINWPPREDAAPELKELHQQEVQILADAVRLGGKEFEKVTLEDFVLNLRVDLTEPGGKVEGTSTKFPANEAPSNAVDDNPKTKYLNFDGKGSGLILEVGNSVAVGIALTSGNDAPERDPRSFALYGSKDGGEFVSIAAGAVPTFSARQQRKRLSFDNSEAYSFYKLVFPELVGPEGTPMQISEVELIRGEASDLDNLVIRAKALLEKIRELRTEVRYIVSRAHLVPLGQKRNRVLVFDSDTLGYSFGWLNESGLQTTGMPFGGAHGSTALIKYDNNLFHTGMRPGWAKSGDLADPRPQKYKSFPRLGALPKDWAHFKGHYVHNGRAIFSYSVGKGTVLDMPGVVEEVGFSAFTRTLETNLPEPGMVVLAEGDSSHKAAATLSVKWAKQRINYLVTDGPEEAKLSFENGLALLRVPAGKHRTKIAFWPGNPAYQPAVQSAAGQAEDLGSLTQGGDAQWGNPIVTKGKVSDNEADAYVVDTLGIPFNNQHEPRMRIGAFDFFADGKTAAVCTWDGDVWIVSGIEGDLQNLQWKRFATGLHEPLGLKIVDGKIYTVGDNQITRFHDLNNDGEADFLENFNHDWDATEGFHAFCFDLQTDPQGNFYFSMGCPVRAGGAGFERLGRHHGCVLKVSPSGGELSIFASGFRAPNGIGVGPNGEVTTGDNEGSFVPTAPLNWVKPGSFNGVVDSYKGDRKLKSSAIEGYEIPYSDWGEYRRSFMNRPGFQHFPEESPKPLVWMSKKRGVDNSGGGQVWVTSDKWGPLQDQLLHMSYGQSKLYVVLKEEKNGQMQGGVSRIPIELSSSAMRARINPSDGQLYVSGLKGWQTNAKGNGGLDRIRYTGKPVHLPSSLRVKKDRIEVGFYEPLSTVEANDLSKFKFGAWDLKWTSNYGSPEIPLDDLKLEKVELLEDGKTVALHVPNLHPAHMVQIDYELKSASGQAFSGRIDHTIHEVE